jgi:hypothetical protein
MPACPARRSRPREPLAVLCAASLALLACTLPQDAAAQSTEEPEAGLHWAFASTLGTGVYRLAGDRTSFNILIPGRFALQRSKIGQENERRIGIELRFPLTLGVLQGNSFDDFVGQESLGTVSFVPGVELEIPVTQDWLLRPFASIGGGWELGEGSSNSSVVDSALIYSAGLKSRWHVPIDQGNWGVLSGVQYTGYDPRNGPSGDLLIVTGGLETRQRLFGLMRGNHALFIEAHGTYNYVSDLSKLREGEVRPLGIDDFWEAGLAVSQGVVPFRLFRIPIERVGIAFQLSTDREYRAVKLSFRSPFRR